MLSKANKITTTNLTMSKTQNVDMDIKDNQLNYQENFDSFQNTFNPVNFLSSLNPM